MIRGYRTFSGEAASLLAGLPPWDLEVEALATLHRWCSEVLSRGETPERWTELQRILMVVWKGRLSCDSLDSCNRGGKAWSGWRDSAANSNVQ